MGSHGDNVLGSLGHCRWRGRPRGGSPLRFHLVGGSSQIHAAKARPRKGRWRNSWPGSTVPKADITTLPRLGDDGGVVRLVPRASLRARQVPAQDPAERPLPKQGRKAWEVQEELEKELEGVLFATPG
jgi:hypothetical protein